MRSFFQRKLWIVLLAAIALGALTVLALSLDNVRFSEAKHFLRNQPSLNAPVTANDVTDALSKAPLWKVLLVWGLLMLMVMLVGMLLSPDFRKRLLRMLFRVAVTVAAFYFFMRRFGPQLFGLQQAIAQLGQQSPPGDAEPAPIFQPPQISPTFSYMISFLFALFWIGVIWALYRGWKRYVALTTKRPLEELARIARSSLHDLSSGRDSSDVIINCYLRMSDVVADKRQLKREVAMTPQEFAQRLERAGLPGDAVNRLTRLFEVVRYGDRKSAPKDITEAVSCLNTILVYCGEAV
jgi:uncharacterized protein DUF4129